MSLKRQEIIDMASKLPEECEIDDVMYRLYVLDKIREGREAAARGETITMEELEKEMQNW